MKISRAHLHPHGRVASNNHPAGPLPLLAIGLPPTHLMKTVPFTTNPSNAHAPDPDPNHNIFAVPGIGDLLVVVHHHHQGVKSNKLKVMKRMIVEKQFGFHVHAHNNAALKVGRGIHNQSGKGDGDDLFKSGATTK